MKEPKIVQIQVHNGMFVLYDDGRVFWQRLERSEDGKTATLEWSEIKYPIPRIPIPPAAARRSARPKHKRK